MKVQQELMRHADIRTTMNVYGKAMEASKREAHGKVVRMVLAPKADPTCGCGPWGKVHARAQGRGFPVHSDKRERLPACNS